MTDDFSFFLSLPRFVPCYPPPGWVDFWAEISVTRVMKSYILRVEQMRD